MDNRNCESKLRCYDCGDFNPAKSVQSRQFNLISFPVEFVELYVLLSKAFNLIQSRSGRKRVRDCAAWGEGHDVHEGSFGGRR